MLLGCVTIHAYRLQDNILNYSEFVVVAHPMKSWDGSLSKYVEEVDISRAFLSGTFAGINYKVAS